MDKNLSALQIFADEAETAEASAEAPAEAETEGSDEEFDGLIKGKYAAAFSRKTQGIIDKRFAKMKGYEKTAKAAEPLLKMISEENPGMENAEPEELIKAYLEKKSAEKSKDVLISAEISAGRMAEERMKNALAGQIEEVKEVYPAFSLKDELRSSPEFSELIRAGIPLKTAYETVNLDKIIGSAMRYAARNAGVKTAEAIKSGGRVQETAAADSASSVMRTDVNRLTEKDIMNILDEVGRGAKITF